ncbi:AAA family ATPase [Clostridium sp. 'deep sea']|uniref:AAA family ATPase n=1 Tax=Clostridium sp. 'deep sea' TaxID=2779445 RepID=UPI0018965938|nr:AAA family ATPase [Clostridium sp. 'deep sea']QOR33668.1 AAA family ATPase [Clostridium sp. 'deep sea']
MKLVIADCDAEYSSRLSSKIVQSTNSKFTIKVITDLNLLVNYLSENNIDILLLCEEFYTEKLNINNIKLVALLSHNSEILNSEIAQNINLINKYQRVSNIIKQIYSLYSEVNPNNLHINNNKSQIICVYSASGGVGKSTIAISLARKFTLLGKKAFYLNLENYPSTGVYLNTNQSGGLSELFMVLKNNKNAALKAEALKRKDPNTGIYYINDVDSLLDLEALTTEDLLQLINILATTMVCDYLIIDCSSYINQNYLSIFDIANQIVVVNENNHVSDTKFKIFKNSGFIYEQYKHKLRLVYNKSLQDNIPQFYDIPIIATVSKVHFNNPLELIEHIANNITININS